MVECLQKNGFEPVVMDLNKDAVADVVARGATEAKTGAELAAAGSGAVEQHVRNGRLLILVEVLVFISLLALGFVYAWRKGVFQWR